MLTAFDVETEAFAPGKRIPPLVCATVRTPLDASTLTFLWSDPTARDAVGWALAHTTMLGHFVAYDLCVVCAQWPELTPLVFDSYEQGKVDDTGIRQKLLDLEEGQYTAVRKGRGFGLDDVASRYGITLDKANPWRTQFATLKYAPFVDWPASAKRYVEEDVDCLLPIWRAQASAAPPSWGPNGHEDAIRQCRADFALLLQSSWGVLVDQSRVDLLVSFIESEHRALQARLLACGLLEPKRKGQPELKRNMKRAQEWLLTSWPDCPRTPTGLPSTDETTLAKSGDPDLAALGKYGTLNAVLSKDVPMLRRGIIHTRYEVLAESGRVTSSDPNMQNLKVKAYSGLATVKDLRERYPQLPPDQPWPPKSADRDRAIDWLESRGFAGEATDLRSWGSEFGIRECLTPRPGCIYISADYSGLELHTWAQVCTDLLGYSRMAELLMSGIDPHLEMGSRILGLSYEEAFAEYKAEPKGRVYDARQTGKVANFGLPGGLGARSLVEYAEGNYHVLLSLEQAYGLKNTWLSTYPEARPYFALINSWIGGSRRSTIIQVRSNRRRGQCYYTEACNTLFQGLGGDIGKDACFRVARAAYAEPQSPLYGTRPILFVHDEILAETPLDWASEAGEELSRIMVATAREWLPAVPCIKAEPAIHRVWTKGASTRRDALGRLVEWVAS